MQDQLFSQLLAAFTPAGPTKMFIYLFVFPCNVFSET